MSLLGDSLCLVPSSWAAQEGTNPVLKAVVTKVVGGGTLLSVELRGRANIWEIRRPEALGFPQGMG